MTRIAEDFASIHFGRAAGKEMGEIFLLSPVAYKYGLHIEPVAYGTFNSLPHIRVGTFPAQGCPSIDNGKEHIEFLRKIYLRCKPWIAETLMYLDHGLQVAETMCEKYQAVRPVIADEKLAQDVANSLDMTRLLIQTNNLYVKTSFSYFEYRENPTAENKNELENFLSQLTNTRKQFMEAPGYGYHLFGVDQLLENIEQALENLQEAEQILAKSPNQEELKLIVAQQQEKYAQILKEYGNTAVKFLHWEGKVDGKDLIRIKGSNLEVKHLRYDSITGMTYKFLTSLPDKAVTVVPKDIQSRSFRPFVLEQPDEHNDYTATIYLSDYPCPGPSWWKFDLYYIPKPPEEVGLEIPWQK
jgi:dsDNA-binding SOS-regulon protein